MKLYDVIKILKTGDVAKANFATNEEWYITKVKYSETELNSDIRYCDKNGNNIGDVVPLTYSNLKADYEII